MVEFPSFSSLDVDVVEERVERHDGPWRGGTADEVERSPRSPKSNPKVIPSKPSASHSASRLSKNTTKDCFLDEATPILAPSTVVAELSTSGIILAVGCGGKDARVLDLDDDDDPFADGMAEVDSRFFRFVLLLVEEVATVEAGQSTVVSRHLFSVEIDETSRSR